MPITPFAVFVVACSQVHTKLRQCYMLCLVSKQDSACRMCNREIFTLFQPQACCPFLTPRLRTSLASPNWPCASRSCPTYSRVTAASNLQTCQLLSLSGSSITPYPWCAANLSNRLEDRTASSPYRREAQNSHKQQAW